MNVGDRIMRAIAFYFSVALFLILLPITLSYSLGYKIDYNAFKIYKTGIIYLNSYPAGASIYINGKRYDGLTPAEMGELKPGTYRVEVRREGFYPWEKELAVRPNMVTKADRIILFPIAQSMKRVSRHPLSDFVISDRNNIYYMTRYGLFRSDMDGGGFKRLASHSDWPQKIIGKKFSPDGNKFLYFDERSACVVYLNPDKSSTPLGEEARVEEALTAQDPILDIFWHSGSVHIIVVTGKDVKVVELLGVGPRNVVSLYKFNKTPQYLYYDDKGDSLYFADTKEGDPSKESSYIYRLDLRQKFFDAFMKLLMKREPEAGYEKR